MISTHDLHWAAGFLDGEGCFTLSRRSPVVAVGQKYSPSLEKLQRIFKYGKVLPRRKQNLFVWKITGHKAVAVMMTVYSLLSPYRQNRIQEILAVFKQPSLRRGYYPHGYTDHWPERVQSKEY